MDIDERILRAGAELFDASRDGLTFLGGMDSAVYAYERAGRRYVLRFTPTDLDHLPRIYGELEFADYLAKGGVSVAQPNMSRQSKLVETLETGMSATETPLVAVSSFDRAEGQHVFPDAPEAWNDAYFRAWGRVTGRMHALARRFTPTHPRPTWQQEDAATACYCQDEEIRARWLRLGEEIAAFPPDAAAYGLIHNDLHPWNLLLHDGGLTVIDLGSCAYNWFAADIAIALYWAIWAGPVQCGVPAEEFPLHFLETFMAGYSTAYDLDPRWLGCLPTLLKHRQVCLYIYFTYVAQVDDRLRDYLLRDAERQIREDIPVMLV
ncbi:MAG: phosphotransferase enzyme family protein [Anaerolineae bacterium]